MRAKCLESTESSRLSWSNHGISFGRSEGGELKMLINIKGKTEVLQDLEKAKKLIDEAGKILYHMPTKIEFEVGGTEKESDAIRPDLDNQ
jgi:hypothetical protein